MATVSVADTTTTSETVNLTLTTRVTFKSKSVPNNFSGLRVDGNRVAMTGAIANNIQSYDATASINYSPLTNVSTGGLTLTVPQNATQFTINSTVTCQVGEDSTYAYGINIPANTLITQDCANQQFVYLKPSNATNTVSFTFKCV